MQSHDTQVAEQGELEQVEQDELKLGETCDVCGRVVDDPDDAYRAELTVSGAMCPSPMVFHKACYEAASAMWQPDPDSYCTVDPEYPETGQWTLPEQGPSGPTEREAQGPSGPTEREAQEQGGA